MFLSLVNQADSGWVKAGNTMCRTMTAEYKTPSLADLQCLPQENTMDTTVSHEVSARRELARDVDKSWRTHLDKLESHYHVRQPDGPKSIEEAVERFKTGKFTVVDKNHRCTYDNWFDHFTWHDPAVQKDQEGFEAARKKLSEAYRLVTLDVAVDPLDKAKASVIRFREATHH